MATCRLVKEGRLDNQLPRDVSLCIFCEANKKECLVVLISFIWIIYLSEDPKRLCEPYMMCLRY